MDDRTSEALCSPTSSLSSTSFTEQATDILSTSLSTNLSPPSSCRSISASSLSSSCSPSLQSASSPSHRSIPSDMTSSLDSLSTRFDLSSSFSGLSSDRRLSDHCAVYFVSSRNPPLPPTIPTLTSAVSESDGSSSSSISAASPSISPASSPAPSPSSPPVASSFSFVTSSDLILTSIEHSVPLLASFSTFSEATSTNTSSATSATDVASTSSSSSSVAAADSTSTNTSSTNTSSSADIASTSSDSVSDSSTRASLDLSSSSASSVIIITTASSTSSTSSSSSSSYSSAGSSSSSSASPTLSPTMHIAFGAETEKETKANFLWGKKLGQGTYARVLIAKRADSNSPIRWAVKIVDKKLLFKHNRQRQLLVEYEVFQRLRNLPSFVNLDFTFQDEEHVYFGLELAPNGDLGTFLTKVGKCDLALARFYTAELILACEAMHSRNLLHRDIKPENLLLDKDWHLKVTDFGTCRVIDQESLISPAASGRARCSFSCSSSSSIPFSASTVQRKARKSRSSLEPSRKLLFDETKASGENTTPSNNNNSQNNNNNDNNNNNSRNSIGAETKVDGSTTEAEVLLPSIKPQISIEINEAISEGEETESESDEDHSSFDTPRARKETFVGSAYYVSPEMLKKEGVGYQADLWAVGCILYKMLVGSPPFKGAHQALTFKLIQERNMFWPADIDPHAKDFIDKVLQLDPAKRIGGKSSATGYQEIRAHPFFDGISWDTLVTTRPPVTPLLEPTVSPATKLTPPKKSVSAYGTLPRSSSSKLTFSQPSFRASSTVWDVFLEPGEVLVFSGPVDKSNPRNPIPTKRMLLLTNKPRLFYVSASSFKVKGVIPWTGMAAEVHSPRVLYIHTPKRKYKLTTNSTSASSWKEEIQRVQAAEITGTLDSCFPPNRAETKPDDPLD